MRLFELQRDADDIILAYFYNVQETARVTRVPKGSHRYFNEFLIVFDLYV